MINLPKCPKCSSEYTYEDDGILICPECTHEWSAEVESEKAAGKKIVKDKDGTSHTCWDCLAAGRLDNHSRNIPDSNIKF